MTGMMPNLSTDWPLAQIPHDPVENIDKTKNHLNRCKPKHKELRSRARPWTNPRRSDSRELDIPHNMFMGSLTHTQSFSIQDLGASGF